MQFRGDSTIVMGDLNAKMGFDTTLFGHLVWKHCLGGRNDDVGKSATFCSFHHPTIGDTLFEHKVCYKASWVSTDFGQTALNSKTDVSKGER